MILCEFCKQHPATLHLTEITNGVKKELHFCARCAQQKGVTFQTHFNLPSTAPAAEEPQDKAKRGGGGLQCPACGITYADFQKVRRLGCSEDYAVFRRYLLPFVEQIHGSVKHTGKFPSRAAAASVPAPVPAPGATRSPASRPDPSRQLTELRAALNRAIEHEEYEKAAGLRDQIRKLEEQARPAQP